MPTCTIIGRDSNTLFIDPTSPLIHQAAAFGNVQDVETELDIGWHGVCLTALDELFANIRIARVRAHFGALQ